MIKAVMTLAACLAIFSTGCSSPDKSKPTITTSGHLGLSVTFSPDPPTLGIETLRIGVHDSANTPVDGANVEVYTTVGAMSMNGKPVMAHPQRNGLYSAAIEVGATRRWLFAVTAKAGDKTGVAHVAVDVR